MFKLATAPLSLLFAGWLLIGSAPEARAYTTHVYHTVNKVSHVTHYRNVTRRHYVNRTHRVVHVTLIKPIRYVSIVKRVHTRTVAVWHRKDVFVSRVLPARRIYSYKTIYVH